MTSTQTEIRIGGMLVGYVAICPRKAWLSMHGLWMEQESDAVALGRLLDETSYARDDKHMHLEAETADGVRLIGKIDRANLKEGVLHETKKGRAMESAHEWQVRFYLWLLKLNGVTQKDGRPFTGMINYPAKRKTHPVTLSESDEKRLARMVSELAALARRPHPPERITNRRICKKCAFEELCYG